MSHFIVKCESCGCTITQCRCFDGNKTITYDVCVSCKTKRIEDNAIHEIKELLKELTPEEKLISFENEVRAVLEYTIPPEYVVRVREGNGPENLAASLAVSVAKLTRKVEKL